MSQRTRLLSASARRIKKAVRLWSSAECEPSSVNLVRPTSKEYGMGFLAALIEQSLDMSGIPRQSFTFEEDPTPLDDQPILGDRSIFAVSPGHIVFAQIEYARMLRRSRYAAGVVSWDVDVIPTHFHAGFRRLDEIWVPCQMAANYLSQSTNVPVAVFPTPILPLGGGDKGAIRRKYKLHDCFLVGYQFDMGSSAERKNPWAAVKIFASAFPHESQDHHLLLKCARADETSMAWRRLVELCGKRRDITLVNEHWSSELVASLFLDVDVYLSPHRSEGYGLTVAHALAHDRYVITTGYGGPVDFTSVESSGHIPYEMVNVGPNPVYPENARWAEPDVSAGAELLRHAAQDMTRTSELGRLGGIRARNTFSLQRSAEWVAQHLGMTSN